MNPVYFLPSFSLCRAHDCHASTWLGEQRAPTRTRESTLSDADDRTTNTPMTNDLSAWFDFATIHDMRID